VIISGGCGAESEQATCGTKIGISGNVHCGPVVDSRGSSARATRRGLERDGIPTDEARVFSTAMGSAAQEDPIPHLCKMLIPNHPGKHQCGCGEQWT
jgi:hypothetical protein